jgi:hypothetical protein
LSAVCYGADSEKNNLAATCQNLSSFIHIVCEEARVFFQEPKSAAGSANAGFLACDPMWNAKYESERMILPLALIKILWQ